MIPARPSPMLRWYFGRHVEARLQRAFAAVRIRGLHTLERSCAAGPVLVVSNHTSWWDPMFCIWLSSRLVRVDGYAMMDAQNLRRLPFLGRLGGFGVEPGSQRDGYRAVKYATRLLGAAGKVVWIFPQGRERPLTEPLRFYPGAAEVAARAPGATLLAVGLRYEFAESEKPYLYVSIGEVTAEGEAPSPRPPASTGRSERTEAVTRQRLSVERELALIDGALRSGDHSEFATYLRASESWGERFATRLLATLTRYPDLPDNADIPERAPDANRRHLES